MLCGQLCKVVGGWWQRRKVGLSHRGKPRLYSIPPRSVVESVPGLVTDIVLGTLFRPPTANNVSGDVKVWDEHQL